MAALLENIHFKTDLALKIDILNEISLLSKALQVRDTDIISAEELVIRSIKTLKYLEKQKVPTKKKLMN